MKFVSRASGQSERGLQVVAIGEMCFQGMGAVEKWIGGDGTCGSVFCEHGGN